jgi:hypothetical protein
MVPSTKSLIFRCLDKLACKPLEEEEYHKKGPHTGAGHEPKWEIPIILFWKPQAAKTKTQLERSEDRYGSGIL